MRKDGSEIYQELSEDENWQKIILGYGRPVDGSPHRRHTVTVHRKRVKSRCMDQQAQPGLAQSVCILPDEHAIQFPNYNAIYEDVWLGNLDVSHI